MPKLRQNAFGDRAEWGPTSKGKFCTKVGYLSKFVATRRQILGLKCTKSISAGAPRETSLWELTALPRL